MKKVIILVSSLFAFVFPLATQSDPSPKIIFEETIFNFDTIMQYCNGEHVFHFTNAGSAPLIVLSAFSSCGCVVPEWPKEPIASNESGSIKVKYNTNTIGSFTKVIVVKTNDPKSPNTVLRIKGVVAYSK